MVDIVHWNPRKRIFEARFLREIPIYKKSMVNNFGDLLGPMIVDRLLDMKGLKNSEEDGRRLLTVGSILAKAQNNDTIWGTGVLGNMPLKFYNFDNLDVRAVRGPLTRRFLKEKFSIDSPEVYGDPAQLTPLLFPEVLENASGKPKFPLTIIPHFMEFKHHKKNPNVISPQRPVFEVLDRIARSEFVVSSSLHGVILAESFGVKAQLYQSKNEHIFKYQDYYEGSGRSQFTMCSSIEEAIKQGGEILPNFNNEDLLNAFPYDLWLNS